MSAVAAVPDAPVKTHQEQLPLFESHRPVRFQLSLGGNVELSLASQDEARMAKELALGRKFYVRITSERDDDCFLDFEASVSKRAHTRVRHSEHGDSVVSSARLAITNLDEDEG